MAEEITLLALARQLEEIYESFTESIRSMGRKNGRKSRLAGSVVHWLAGSHVKTERDVLCEKFLNDVQKHLEVFGMAMEGAEEAEIREALEVVADVMTQPLDPSSNSTTVLMKRAMVGQLSPYLAYLSREKLEEIKDRMESAYKKSQRLPVEKTLLKEIDGLLS